MNKLGCEVLNCLKMMTFIVCLIYFVPITAQNGSTSDYRISGINYFHKKKYNEAFSCFLKSAQGGDAEGQEWLGDMYYSGLGTSRNSQQALYWYQKAADQGLASARNKLELYHSRVEKNDYAAVDRYKKTAGQGNASAAAGTLYRISGINRFHEKKYNEAFDSFTRSARMGDAEGQEWLGDMYYSGLGTSRNSQQASYWYQKAAEQGLASAQNKLGLYYSCIANDDYKAVGWYKKAAEQGNASAQHHLGRAFYLGEGVPKDDKQAFYWFQKAAEHGFETWQIELGDLYYFGDRVPQDYKQAAYWYQKAAEQGLAEAQNKLGMYYIKIEKDKNKAVEWFKKAADQGNELGQLNMGYMYYAGEGVPKDYKQSFYWYQKAADQGNAWGQDAVAWAYFDGEGVNKDVKQAIVWIEKAAKNDENAQADAGYMYSQETPYKDYAKAIFWLEKAIANNNAKARSNMGWMYENGYGVKKNLKKAVSLYQQAADMNNIGGLRNLGRMYENGLGGCNVDYQKAMQLYKRAAEQNNSKAMRNIGELYEKGLGVPKDMVMAYSWYKKAAEAGDEESEMKISAIKGIFSKEYSGLKDVVGTRNETVVTDVSDVVLPPLGKRIALVIGNGDYKEGIYHLENPTSDAMAMAGKLKQLGFEIFSLRSTQSKNKKPTTNLDLAAIDEVIDAFCTEAKNYDVALFYYSGHAFQCNGKNYLVPIDAPKIERDIEIRRNCYDIDDLTSKLQASEVKTRFYIFDACRTHPYGNSRGIATQGLALIGSAGSYTAYATQSGKTASDGRGQKHSPYTTALLNALDEPALNFTEMFQRVKDDVWKATNGEQLPSEINNLHGRFYFNLNRKK